LFRSSIPAFQLKKGLGPFFPRIPIKSQKAPILQGYHKTGAFYSELTKLLLLLEVIRAVLLLESLNPAGRIDVSLLASIEWVADRADFCMDFLRGAARLESIAAAAPNRYRIVLRMYTFFHNLFSGITKAHHFTYIAPLFNKNLIL
jgi:hypothetical protein